MVIPEAMKWGDDRSSGTNNKWRSKWVLGKLSGYIDVRCGRS